MKFTFSTAPTFRLDCLLGENDPVKLIGRMGLVSSVTLGWGEKIEGEDSIFTDTYQFRR